MAGGVSFCRGRTHSGDLSAVDTECISCLRLSYLWLHLNQCHLELLRRSHGWNVFCLKSGWSSSLCVACIGLTLSEQPLQSTLYDHKVMNCVVAVVRLWCPSRWSSSFAKDSQSLFKWMAQGYLCYDRLSHNTMNIHRRAQPTHDRQKLDIQVRGVPSTCDVLVRSTSTILQGHERSPYRLLHHLESITIQIRTTDLTSS